jgi:hypothetical protein
MGDAHGQEASGAMSVILQRLHLHARDEGLLMRAYRRRQGRAEPDMTQITLAPLRQLL